MKHHKLPLYLLLCLLLLPAFMPGTSQAHETAVTDSQWQTLTSDEAFYYRNEKEAIEKIKPVRFNVFDKIAEALYRFFSSSTGKIIVWSVFFIVLGWALFKIFMSDSTRLLRKRAEKQGGDDEITEEDVLDANWEILLQDAIQKQHMRLVVRYSYMWLLQLMQQNNLIQYRQHKTDHDYYTELADAQYRQPFKQLLRQYEYAWYGDYPLSAEAYEKYMDTFNMLKNRLTRQ